MVLHVESQCDEYARASFTTLRLSEQALVRADKMTFRARHDLCGYDQWPFNCREQGYGYQALFSSELHIRGPEVCGSEASRNRRNLALKQSGEIRLLVEPPEEFSGRVRSLKRLAWLS